MAITIVSAPAPRATPHTIRGAQRFAFPPEAEMLDRLADALQRPMPAADRALVDEAIRLYALGQVLPS